jgi:hypothetical protein
LKNVILIVTFIFVNIAYCQEPFNENILIEKTNQIIDEYSDRIHSTEEKDTVYGSNFLKMTRYYGNNNKLIKRVNLNPRSPLGISGLRTEIYNDKGNRIIERNQDRNGKIWYLSIKDFDESGNLIKEMTFDFKYVFTKLYEYDSENKLIKIVFYNSKGRKVKSEKRAKRKKPYNLKN